MSESLRGRVGVITGASAGIGRAIALRLAGAGASLVLNARREDRLRELAAECQALGSGGAAVVGGDACEGETIQAMLDGAVGAFGRAPDTVIVNAGRGLRGSPLSSDESEWEEVVRINLLAAARLLRAGAERMIGEMEAREDGSPGDWPGHARDIVVISSTVGKHISPFSSMYGSTKFAATAIAEAARRELGPKGIRVTAIHPGIVRSEFQDVAGYDPVTFGQFMEKIGPVLEPDDVARAVAFIVGQPAHVHVNDIMIRPTRQEYP